MFFFDSGRQPELVVGVAVVFEALCVVVVVVVVVVVLFGFQEGGARGEREREFVFFLIRRSWTRSRSLSTAAVDRAARGDSAGQSSTSPAAGRSAAPRERRIRQNKRRKTNADTHTIEPKGEHVRRHQSAHGRHGRRPLRGNRQLHLCSSDRKST